jgi:hypothetical protein
MILLEELAIKTMRAFNLGRILSFVIGNFFLLRSFVGAALKNSLCKILRAVGSVATFGEPGRRNQVEALAEYRCGGIFWPSVLG